MIGNTKEQCFLDTAWHLHICTLNAFDSKHTICTSSSKKNTSVEQESGHEIPSLSEELLVFSNFWEKENVFSLAMCLWEDQLYTGAGLNHKTIWGHTHWTLCIRRQKNKTEHLVGKDERG